MVNLKQLEEESDARTQKLLDEQTKVDIRNFDAKADVKHLPYAEKNLIFEQQGKRIIWRSRGQRYASARYYPNEECAREVMELLRELRK